MKKSNFKHNPKSEYYIRAKRQIDDLLGNIDFIKDSQNMGPYDLIMKYNIVSSAWPVLLSSASNNYIEDVDYSLISCPIKVVSDHDKTREPSLEPNIEYNLYKNQDKIYLEISKDITQPELKDFIIKEFSSLIKPKLNVFDDKRKKIVRNKSNKIQQDIYFLHDIGIKPKEIANKTGYALEKVKSELGRRKR